MKMNFSLFATIVSCMLFGVFLAWGIQWLWKLDDAPVTSTMKEQMMHRKTRTMENVLDGLVRGDWKRVENSAEQMWEIGHSLNWYLANPIYANNDQVFRDSTSALLEAARQRDHSAAKESALRLERSCIECHALINQ